jgi:ribose transport system substrate-binding protein
MPGRIVFVCLALILAVMGVGCTDTSHSSRRGTGPSTSGPSLKFVGFDANPTLIEALRQGKLQGLVLQNPHEMGDLGVRTLVVHLEKGEVKSRIGTGEKMATPENMSEPGVDQLLNPPTVKNGAKAQKESDPGTPEPKSKKWRVLVIPKATTNEFWQTVHAGALEVAEELGNVEILWEGPEKEDDYTRQIELVQTAKTLGVDGIVLAPLDSKALVSPVDQAIDHDIPVVIIDSGLESQRTVSTVATDNYHGGVLAAKRIAELLGGKGDVIVLRHMVGSDSTEQREEGFLETIRRYPEIKVLSQNQYAGATEESAQKIAQDLIENYKGQVNGIFCSNEQSTMGMLKALEEAGMLKGAQPETTPAPAPIPETKKIPKKP